MNSTTGFGGRSRNNAFRISHSKSTSLIKPVEK